MRVQSTRLTWYHCAGELFRNGKPVSLTNANAHVQFMEAVASTSNDTLVLEYFKTEINQMIEANTERKQWRRCAA